MGFASEPLCSGGCGYKEVNSGTENLNYCSVLSIVNESSASQAYGPDS